MPYRQEVRREVWKITEWRDGCVYKTKSLGLVWIPLDEVAGMREGENFDTYYKRIREYEKQIAKEHGGDMLGPGSSSLPFEETMRSVKV